MTDPKPRPWSETLKAAAAEPAGGPSCTPGDDAIDFGAIPPAAGYETFADFQAEIMRLAALPVHEYDRCRREEAKRLGVRTPTLDKAVQAARPKDAADHGQGRPITFEDPEPWDEPVAGDGLLDEVAATLSAYVVLRPHDDVKCALWAAHTHCYKAFFNTPRLAVTSPEPQCGKSTLFDVLAELCFRPKTSEGLTAAVVYRLVNLAQPTLLLDEADAWLIEGEDLRAVIDSGHKATGTIQRNVEVNGEWIPREFSSFCPVAIAAIRRGAQRLPATIESRSISIKMRRALRGEARRNFRPDRARDELAPLRRKLARFAADHIEALADADPVMPEAAFNRFADNWRPLMAIAVAAGGRWPEAAKAAILAELSAYDTDALGAQLLEDIRVIFDACADEAARRPPAEQQLSSVAIVTALKEMADRPWNELGRNNVSITQNKLARMLKDFEIEPSGNMRLPNGKVVKGYLRGAFAEAWNCYLSPEGGSATATPLQPTESATKGRFATATKNPDVAVANRQNPRQSAACSGAAVAKPPLGKEKDNGAETEAHAGGADAGRSGARGARVQGEARRVAGDAGMRSPMGLQPAAGDARADEHARRPGNGSARHPEGVGAAAEPGTAEACPVCGEEVPSWELTAVEGATMCVDCAGVRDDAAPALLTCQVCNGLFPSSGRGLRPEQSCPDCRRTRAG